MTAGAAAPIVRGAGRLKVAASDYDGTLFRGGEISGDDVRGVRRWRAAGHKFGVVTGRDYGMLVPQLRHYGIGFDFAVCNNGGIVRDAAGRVLCQSRIAPAVLAALLAEECVQDSFHFAFSAADCTYLCHEREGSWIMREAQAWDFPIVKVSEGEAAGLPAIQQFSLGFSSSGAARACSEALNERYGQDIHAYPNRGSVDITPAGVSKREGIRALVRAMGWDEPDIFAIGDETNDLPMLEAFAGFTVDTARAAIKERASASFACVGAMLEHYCVH